MYNLQGPLLGFQFFITFLNPEKVNLPHSGWKNFPTFKG